MSEVRGLEVSCLISDLAHPLPLSLVPHVITLKIQILRYPRYTLSLTFLSSFFLSILHTLCPEDSRRTEEVLYLQPMPQLAL